VKKKSKSRINKEAKRRKNKRLEVAKGKVALTRPSLVGAMTLLNKLLTKRET
jgi:hypothetical protein